MIVVVANDLPPAVRGRMKLWFIEPKPGVFVSGVKDALAKRVINYLSKHCDQKTGMLIFCPSRIAPGYRIYSFGETDRELITLGGLQLIKEKGATP